MPGVHIYSSSGTLSVSTRFSTQSVDVIYRWLQTNKLDLSPTVALRAPFFSLCLSQHWWEFAWAPLLSLAFMYFWGKYPVHGSGGCWMKDFHWKHIQYPKSNSSVHLGPKRCFYLQLMKRGMEAKEVGRAGLLRFYGTIRRTETKPLNFFLEEGRLPTTLPQEEWFLLSYLLQN